MKCPHCNKYFKFTKITTKDIAKIKQLSKEGLSVRAIAAALELSASKVYRVITAIEGKGR